MVRALRCPIANAETPRLLRLDTATLQSLRQTDRGLFSPVGATAERGVIFVNMDDDYAGHSVWPHYVYGVDETGEPAWQFPNHLLLPGLDFDLATGKGFPATKGQDGRDFEDVAQAQVIAAANIVIVSSEYALSGAKTQINRPARRMAACCGASRQATLEFLAGIRSGLFRADAIRTIVVHRRRDRATAVLRKTTRLRQLSCCRQGDVYCPQRRHDSGLRHSPPAQPHFCFTSSLNPGATEEKTMKTLFLRQSRPQFPERLLHKRPV